MLYLERIPATPLNRYIHRLWYARAGSVLHRRERILPTGRAQIILNLARDFLLDCPENQPDRVMPHSLVIGARSVYEIVDTADMADLIGIVFTPGGFAPFASDSAHLFSNQSVALEDIWGNSTTQLRDQLLEVPTPQARLRCLERFLLLRFAPRLDRPRSPRSAEVDFALNSFQRQPHIATIASTARRIGCSERRFSQIFREEVGFTPKVWCRIQRFQRAVRQLHNGADLRWADIALDCGYYDQSHFANEFRAFSGIDATTYSTSRTRWVNHIPVAQVITVK